MLAQLGETPRRASRVARRRLSARHAAQGRQLVRPLGPELHLRHLVFALRAQRLRHRPWLARKSARRSIGWCRSRTRTAAGAKTARATSSTIVAMSRRPAPHRRRPGLLLGLMACGEVGNPAVARGVQYLAQTQTDSGFWDEERFTATGFPRVFYLRYHGYRKFFPLWALARYRNLTDEQQRERAFRHVIVSAPVASNRAFCVCEACRRNRPTRFAHCLPHSSSP